MKSAAFKFKWTLWYRSSHTGLFSDDSTARLTRRANPNRQDSSRWAKRNSRSRIHCVATVGAGLNTDRAVSGFDLGNDLSFLLFLCGSPLISFLSVLPFNAKRMCDLSESLIIFFALFAFRDFSCLDRRNFFVFSCLDRSGSLTDVEPWERPAPERLDRWWIERARIDLTDR